MNLRLIATMRTASQDDRGLTAVELAVAVAILTFLVTLSLLLVRRHQYDALQARVNAAPADVFQITLTPERDTVTEGEAFAFICDVCNPTDFPLTFTWDDWGLHFLGIRMPDTPEADFRAGERSILEWSSDGGWSDPIGWTSNEPMPNYRIAPGDTARFKFEFSQARLEGAALPPEGVDVTAWLHRPSTWRVGDPLVENSMILERFTLLPYAQSQETEPGES